MSDTSQMATLHKSHILDSNGTSSLTSIEQHTLPFALQVHCSYQSQGRLALCTMPWTYNLAHFTTALIAISACPPEMAEIIVS